MTAPSTGQTVHYVSYGTPGGEYTSQCRAAIVTRVSAAGQVDLCVINPEGLFFNRGVRQGDEDKAGGTWHWPEHV